MRLGEEIFENAFFSKPYVDLPDSLPEGPASITISGPEGNLTSDPIDLEILPGIGTPIGMLDQSLPSDPNAVENMLGALERAEHVTVSFSGSTVPHCIQVELFRDAGIGTPWVVNPRGDLKNVVWGDDGGSITVLLTPTNSQTPSHFSDFKFYVAGGVTGLQIDQLIAYDKEGNQIPDLIAYID